MAAGVLFAPTLPGLVVLLVAVAAVEHAWSRAGRRSPLHGRRRSVLSAGGLDAFSPALVSGRDVDLEQQRAREIRRDDVDDGAPPYGRIDLATGVAWLDLPPGTPPAPPSGRWAAGPTNGNPQDTSASPGLPTVGTDRTGGGRR